MADLPDAGSSGQGRPGSAPVTSDLLTSAAAAASAGAGQGNVGEPTVSCSEPQLSSEIAVRVLNSEMDPLKGVDVSVSELGLSGQTGLDGNYDFGEVAPGTYTVVA